MRSKTFSSTYVLVASALCVVINLVGGTLTQATKLSAFLFLDTVGTIFAAAAFGIVPGMIVGLATNLVLGFTAGPTNIPFALVNIVVALVVGLMTRRGGFGYGKATVTGLILSVVCPLIGTPIAVWLFGGLTGGGVDFFVAWLLKSGASIFTAAFLPRIASNLLDKVISALLVAFLLQRLPATLRRGETL